VITSQLTLWRLASRSIIWVTSWLAVLFNLMRWS
jgi:hypothetical protein